MAMNTPPMVAPPAPPPPRPTAAGITLAQASAMGTTAGAPVQNSMGPPPGSGQPGAGPSAPPPGAAPPPPPIAPPSRPVVGPHAANVSVGTHPSASPEKQANPVHGMTAK